MIRQATVFARGDAVLRRAPTRRVIGTPFWKRETQNGDRRLRLAARRAHVLLVGPRVAVLAHGVALRVDEHAVLPARVDAGHAHAEEPLAQPGRVRAVQPLL